MKEHYLSRLRDKKTTTQEFRRSADSLSRIIAAEVSSTIRLKAISVETPLAPAQGAILDTRIVLIPILRSGLALLPFFQELFPSSPIGFLGIRRDERNAHPISYYEHIPTLQSTDRILLLDPMLATGGSALCALATLKKNHAPLSHVTLVTLIASQAGVDRVRTEHPDVQIYSVAVDPILNADWLIVPGLGDFGDRYFSS